MPRGSENSPKYAPELHGQPFDRRSAVGDHVRMTKKKPATYTLTARIELEHSEGPKLSEEEMAEVLSDPTSLELSDESSLYLGEDEDSVYTVSIVSLELVDP